MVAFVIDSSADHIGLGRWSWDLVEGESGHITYFITVYMPCGNARVDEATVYNQQERSIQEKGLKTNPKATFRENLLVFP